MRKVKKKISDDQDFSSYILIDISSKTLTFIMLIKRRIVMAFYVYTFVNSNEFYYRTERLFCKK